MQKLLTVALRCRDMRQGAVEEHLQEYLTNGWRVVSLTSIGSSSPVDNLACVAVVLEKGGPTGQFLNSQLGGLGSIFPALEYPESDEGIPVEPSDIPVGPDTPLDIGSRVLSFSQGRWWRAEVVGFAGSDGVKIHFPGWDAKWDVVVPREELQVDIHAAD